MRRIRRIIHASDFSKASRAAFAKAVDLAKAYRAELLVLHVLSVVPPFLGEGYIAPQVWNDIEAVQTMFSEFFQGPLPVREHTFLGETHWRSEGGTTMEVKHHSIITNASSRPICT